MAAQAGCRLLQTHRAIHILLHPNQPCPAEETNAMIRLRPLALIAALATVLVLIAADANARAGRGGSFGSRGFNTFNSAPTTRTAPNAAQPIQRSVTQPGQTGGALARGAARPGFFGGGLLGGLAAGFIGAGLFGLLFGHGFLGGMGGFASFLGLLLQIALIVIVAKLAFAWWQRRNSPAFATAHADGPRGGTQSNFMGFGSMFGGNTAPTEPLTIGKDDYDAQQGHAGSLVLFLGRACR
jgi:hypothetical protein